MKKEVILEALKNAGIELEEDKQKEFIKAIQVANGVDIELAKKDYADKEREIADLKAKYENDLKIKDEALKRYNDTEIDELRKFKEQTLLERKNAIQDTALKELIGKDEYKFDKKAIELLSAVAKNDVKFNDNNEITNAEELMSKLTEKYKDFVVSTTVEGANPSQPQSSQTVDLNKVDFETYKRIRKEQNK